MAETDLVAERECAGEREVVAEGEIVAEGDTGAEEGEVVAGGDAGAAEAETEDPTGAVACAVSEPEVAACMAGEVEAAADPVGAELLAGEGSGVEPFTETPVLCAPRSVILMFWPPKSAAKAADTLMMRKVTVVFTPDPPTRRLPQPPAEDCHE